MPIYEYLCPKCGPFEAIQGFSDKPLNCKPDCTEKSCPKKAERLISASAFHLKGSGWYKTDYASSASSSSSSGGKKTASVDSSASAGDTTSSAGGSGDKKEAGALAQAKCGSKCGCH
ncbi:MAG: zinc ribbon domain-containing protein [Proteobacteria bacterium]|nr:zinc ribbon domain-containing protein [Pseudomonadota bacterium]